MENNKPVTLTAKEAAEYLGISYWLILEMTKKKEVPFIGCGSRKLFRKEALDSWMVEKEKSSVTQESNNIGYGALRKIY